MKGTELKINKSSWKETKLGDLAEEISVRVDNPSKSKFERFVGLEHFISGELKIKNWGNTQSVTSSAKAFKKGDILFARRNAYLRRASMVNFDGCCSGDALVIREDHAKITPGFLSFLMNSNRLWDYANANAAGTMSKRVKWRDLAEYQFLLPPKAQQEQLADLLWALDDVLEKEREVLLKTIALLPVITKYNVFKQEFEIVPLGKVINRIIAGKSLMGNSPISNSNEKAVIKVSAVGPNGFDPQEHKKLINQKEFIDIFKINKGDLLITRANTTELVGRVCLVDNDHPNLMLSDKTLKIDIDENLINKTYLLEILKSQETRQQIEGFATGTGGAMKNISQNEIKSIKIPLPTTAKQKIIADQISSSQKSIDSLRNIITTSQALQKSLINQIF
jgi:type I restriction enzyme, S subunit